MIRFLRLLLFPFSFLYGFVTAIRNVFFDMGWLPSYKPKVKTITVGNLNTGGTGKTPFTELLILLLSEKHTIAVVSRGYGRKTKGFIWVDEFSDARSVGDESLQVKQKFPSIQVAVCEKRIVAIKKIEKECPDVDLILLDDAFQHRYVEAQINILLSTYHKPFYEDYMLPTGNLREWRKGAERADYIVVTKCPADLTPTEKVAIQKKMKIKVYQHVIFSHEKYGKAYDLFTKKVVDISAKSALLVSGIADNSYLLNHIKNDFGKVDSYNLPDHVDYNKSLVSLIKIKYDSLNNQNRTCILTTEKDAIKLRSFENELSDIPVYVIPFEHALFDTSAFVSNLEDKIMT